MSCGTGFGLGFRLYGPGLALRGLPGQGLSIHGTPPASGAGFQLPPGPVSTVIGLEIGAVCVGRAEILLKAHRVVGLSNRPRRNPGNPDAPPVAPFRSDQEGTRKVN
jgi:hypothetical protein